jgi:predicted GNAT family acetyltransferase
MTASFIDNKTQNRFEYHIEGSMAFANYRRKGQTLFIDYVEAPPQLRGTGAAGKLMEQVMSVAQKEDLSIVPICGYAASWIQRHTSQ